VSGFGGDDVHFLGFLPKGATRQRERLREAAATAAVLVLFESPNRLAATLATIAEALDDPETAVCRELTKVHEETVRGHASELAERFAHARGECVIVVQSPPRRDAPVDEAKSWLDAFQRAGAQRSTAAAEVAQRFGLRRGDVYAWWDDAG
jgi:16S rRNA (cytidine1402-2'-O)-methyltransferase